MKKIIFMLITLILLTGCTISNNNDKLSIISTNFVGYDFARAIIKDSNIELSMLLKPGSESHSYEPTPQDIINISKSDIFIYVGGESDSWIDGIMDNIDTSKTKIIKMMDLVTLYEEEYTEGMESDHDHDHEEKEYDEHVWTSPQNAITITKNIMNEIIKIDSDNKELYETNGNNYISEITKVDNEIRNIVNNGTRKEIIFADRFPLLYFAQEYGLTYYAAFPGCSESTEPSASTIAFLINKVKKDNIPVVFHLELSNQNIAKIISEETGAKVLEFNAAHNISSDDFTKGVTYVDLMKKNIEVLKEALN